MDEGDGKYARDDGTLVPFEDCTRDELLLAIGQLRRAICTQRRLIERMEQGHKIVRQQAYARAAAVVASLKD